MSRGKLETSRSYVGLEIIEKLAKVLEIEPTEFLRKLAGK